MPDTQNAAAGTAEQDVQHFEIEKYAWIVDENLLRDEGVTYGLSESDTSEKVNTIRQYFQEKIAAQDVVIEYFRDVIEDGKARIKALEERRTENEEKYQIEYLKSTTTYHHFLRIIFGFAAFSFITVFNFWLVYDWLLPEWKHFIFIAVGVYIFGIFSQYRKRPLIYEDEEQANNPKWKVVLEEIGIPIIATFFILTWGDIENIVWWRSASYFLIVLFLFLYSGRAVLSYFIHLRENYKAFWSNVRASRLRRKKLQRLQKEISASMAKRKEIENQLMKAKEIIGEKKSDKSALRQKMETTVSYFLSEYALAIKSKRSLSNRQFTSLVTLSNK